MIPYSIRRLLLAPTEIHILCAIIAILGCLPILFPEVCPKEYQDATVHYAGWMVWGAICLSGLLMGIAAFVHMLRLRNVRAFWLFLTWMSTWGIATIAFVFIAILADIPLPVSEQETTPIQTTTELHPAADALSGPTSLVLPIDTTNQQINTIEEVPHLQFLEKEHRDILNEYLSGAPRWCSAGEDDLFYSKPGHVVMIPPSTGGTPGLVHVSFRRLYEGDPLPGGYTFVKPGDPMPLDDDKQTRIPDLAIDLGGQHFLLVVWRGADHEETAGKAINAAIAETDERLRALAESPDRETMKRMITGKDSYPGSTPELRLMEPPSQEGTYQAEIYANPGEPGTILLYIKEQESDRTLRLLNCPARYSNNPNEQFRHDIPGSVPLWLRNTFRNSLDTIFPEGTPLFIIRKSSGHQYFGAAFEVWFTPSDTSKPSRLLLRRCYKVQGYEPA